MLSILFLSSVSLACPVLTGKYGSNDFYEKYEQKNCEELTISWFDHGQEVLKITKKLDGKLSSNSPHVKNEFTSMHFESDHLYYVVVNSAESGFSEGREYKLPSGDMKRITRWYRDGNFEDIEDILPLVH
jgi:hypothetical protein